MARFWEIDAARGAAVLGMLAFNWLYALAFYGLLAFDASASAPGGGFWFWFARAVGAAFVFLAGASLWLSLSLRRESENHAFMHAANIFGLGLLITGVTWLVIPREFIVFGILHCIGLSLLLAIPLVNVKPRNLALLGLAVIALGVGLSSLTFGFPWLVWLGFAPSGFVSVDYFPLAPWFGVLLLGLAFAKKFYGNAKARTAIQSQTGGVITGVLRFLGRHSLAIYLLHQPLLLAALLIAGAHPVGLNFLP